MWPQQASLLYLLLCFSPGTLHRDGPLMRTLVDRHYADGWVVPWGMGYYTDLAVEWDSFPAARAALATAVSVTRARDVAAATTALLPDLHASIAAHLSKGHLTVPAQTSEVVMHAISMSPALPFWTQADQHFCFLVHHLPRSMSNAACHRLSQAEMIISSCGLSALLQQMRESSTIMMFLRYLAISIQGYMGNSTLMQPFRRRNMFWST